MKIKTILVNNRYLIYMDDGCIYDTKKGKDIPQEVFDLRDKILNNLFAHTKIMEI